MLISVWVFVHGQDRSYQPVSYPLRVSSSPRGRLRLFPIYLHHLFRTLRDKSFPGDVSFPHLVQE